MCAAQVFASLYTLSKNRKATDLRWTAARVVLEFLQVTRQQHCRSTSAAAAAATAAVFLMASL
jgi:hypothetical protein